MADKKGNLGGSARDMLAKPHELSRTKTVAVLSGKGPASEIDVASLLAVMCGEKGAVVVYLDGI